MSRRGDNGFTLVELLVAVGITAVLAAAVTQAMVVGWNTTSVTIANLKDTGNRQQLPVFFGEDVQSAATVDTAAGSCVGGGQTLLVRMSWSETVGVAAVSRVAAYVRATVSTDAQLIRNSCDNSSGAMTLAGSSTVAHGVTAATVTCYDTAGTVTSPSCATVRRVTVSVTDPSGTFTSTARRRTP